MLQDAHEFLNYLLNECSELLEKEQAQKHKASSTLQGTNGTPPTTWVHELFQVSQPDPGAFSVQSAAKTCRHITWNL